MSASNLTGPLIAIGLFGLLNTVIAAISMKYPRARRVFQEEPNVLRPNQLTSLADVKFAALEP